MVLAGGIAPAIAPAAARAGEPSYSILHSFQGAESNPQAALTSDGRGNIYGTTSHGGPSDGGTVFTLRTDGTGFQRLHTFVGGESDGLQPAAPLVLDGSGNLYGTTMRGGASNGGTLFRLRVDGSDFALLHSFAGASDGWNPAAALTSDGSGNLYGTASAGGASNFGTIFRLRTDGTAFQILHTFRGGAGGGRNPRASLILAGSGSLCGTTLQGGQPGVLGVESDGTGTLFRIGTDGTGFQVLRAFPAAAKDGLYPSGPLVADAAGNLYGMTTFGGAGFGTVFRVREDGSAFLILHSFAGLPNDGADPVDALVLDRSGNLYGMTKGAGGSGSQAIFKLRTDGAGYQLLHTFVEPGDGNAPSGALILDGSDVLYGTMSFGGSSNSGTLFSIGTDGRLFQVVHPFAGFTDDGSHPLSSVIRDGSGYIYGTTPQGGPSYAGTVFRMRPDGSGFQILHAFSGGVSDWGGPQAAVVLDGAGNLYGTTNLGGSSNAGSIFRMRTDGSGFQLLHAFAGGADDGARPAGALVLDGANNLYGTASHGGPTDRGVVFRVRTDGSGYQILHTFSDASLSSEGGGPLASLLLDGAGNLIGTTASIGTGGGGVFRMRTDGTGFGVLHAFAGGTSDGSQPTSSLIADGLGNLYGTTSIGGSSNSGTVFRMRTDGTGFRLLHSFAGGASDGRSPNAALLLDAAGNLYGTASSGGPSNAGTVFTVRTDGTAYRTLHTFGGVAGDGNFPVASLLLDGSSLVGTTEFGGEGDFGCVFALSIGRVHEVATPGPFAPVRKR